MPMDAFAIDSPITENQGTTTSATPLDFPLAGLEDGSAVTIELFVVLRRPSTNAFQVWVARATLIRVGAVVTITDSALTKSGSAAHRADLAACTIAVVESSSEFILRCTGDAGAPLDWAAEMFGYEIRTVP